MRPIYRSEILYSSIKYTLLGVKKAKIGPQSSKTEFGFQNQYGRVIYSIGNFTWSKKKYAFGGQKGKKGKKGKKFTTWGNAPRGNSPWGNSLRGNSPRGNSMRSNSPQGNSPQGNSPRGNYITERQLTTGQLTARKFTVGQSTARQFSASM
jgi:hypothetical protein